MSHQITDVLLTGAVVSVAALTGDAALGRGGGAAGLLGAVAAQVAALGRRGDVHDHAHGPAGQRGAGQGRRGGHVAAARAGAQKGLRAGGGARGDVGNHAPCGEERDDGLKWMNYEKEHIEVIMWICSLVQLLLFWYENNLQRCKMCCRDTTSCFHVNLFLRNVKRATTIEFL